MAFLVFSLGLSLCVYICVSLPCCCVVVWQARGKVYAPYTDGQVLYTVFTELLGIFVVAYVSSLIVVSDSEILREGKDGTRQLSSRGKQTFMKPFFSLCSSSLFCVCAGVFLIDSDHWLDRFHHRLHGRLLHTILFQVSSIAPFSSLCRRLVSHSFLMFLTLLFIS